MADSLFLDANVLFTAARRPDGKAAFLFHALDARRAGPWQLLSSPYVVEEARRNLARKFPDALLAWSVLERHLQIVAQPAVARLALALPEKDQPVWAAALAAGASHLLTGDLRDFGAHMNQPARTGGVIIQTVADCLAGWRT